MNDLEEGVYEHYKIFTTGLLEEIKNDNIVACKIIRMLIITIIISFILLATTNMIWLYEFSQYDYETYTIESSDGGNANYIGEKGVIINGESNSEKSNKTCK